MKCFTWTAWLKFLSAATCHSRGRYQFALTPRRRPRSVRCAAAVESLEVRELLTLDPITLVDASVFGQTGDGNSLLTQQAASISADGQLIVFQSDANDLAPNDTNRASNNANPLTDVFLYNRATGLTSLVSVNLTGTASGNGISTNPKISPDGRYVLFESTANDLTAEVRSQNISFSGSDIFLRDLQTGTTTLISKSLSGTASGNARSQDAEISADGHFVVFTSQANNLVAGDGGGFGADVFVRDLINGTTTLVSHQLGAASVGGNGSSLDPRISDDGRFVAFSSIAGNLVSNDGTNVEDIYVWDRQSGVIELLSVDSNEVNQSSSHNSLAPGRAFSADGRYVLFETAASNLVPQNASFQGSNVYLRDRQLGTTVAVTLSANGQLATGGGAASMTADGRYIAFVSDQTDLVAGLTDTNGGRDVFLRDMQSGTTELVSRNATGSGTGNQQSGTAQYEFNFSSGAPSLSDDARYVAFASEASNLVAGMADLNNGLTGTQRRDVFIRDRQTGITNLISQNIAGTGTGAGGSYTPAMSSDGRVVAFESLANDLVSGPDSLGRTDVFVRDVTAEITDLASQRTPLFPEWRLMSSGGQLDDATPDGQFVSFSVPGGGGVYVRDRLSGTVEEVSSQPNGAPGSGSASRISADGRFVVFMSSLNLATDGPSGSGSQIWIRDRQTAQTRLVSLTPAGLAAGGSEPSSSITLTPDGRYVAWTSTSQNLVSNFVDGNGNNAPYGGFLDVFIRDLHTGVTRLVSHVPNNPSQSGNSFSASPIFSADGSQLIFTSRASDLVSGITDVNNWDDVFAFDVVTGAIELVSANTAGTGTGNQTSEHPVEAAVSSDGRYVAVSSNALDVATGIVSGQFGRNRNIVVRDLLTNTTTLVSVNAPGTSSGSGYSYAPSISGDGRYVAFTSEASNLVAGDTGGSDVFVRDTVTGTTTRVSVTPAGGQADSISFQPLISSDGRRVSFYSRAGNLVAKFVDVNGGLFGGGDDLYVRDLQLGVTDLVSINDSGTASGDDDASPGNVRRRVFTTNGDTLFFTGNPTDLVVADRNSSTDVFAYTFAGAGQIRGTVFYDFDHDGIRDAGDTAVPFWTVYLDANANGKFDGDERSVRTDAMGNYALTGLAAGTYTVALVLPDGFSPTVPANPVSRVVVLVTATSVISGQDFGTAAAGVDLQVSGVNSPQSVAAGRSFDVSWIVRNLGESATLNDWQDAVYISEDLVLDASDILIGVVPHTGGLASQSNYSRSLTIAAVPDIQGIFHVLVQTDRRRQVSEDLNRLNNVATSPAVDVGLPQLVVGTPFADTFNSPNQDLYYQFTVVAGQSLILSLDSAAASGSTELYLRRGQLPTPWDYDFLSRSPGQPDQKLIVPVTQSGVYYVLARSRAGTAATSAFTVTAALPGLKVERVSTNVGGNAGRVTIKIEGGGFTPSTIASLVSGGTSLDATFVDFRNPSLIYATFDLVGRAVGFHDVRVRDGANSNSSAGAFQVVAGGEGDIDVDIQLLAPEFARTNAGIAVGIDTRPRIIVTYENKGNVDVAAPLFQLTTDFGELDIQQHTVIDENGALTFLGVGADGPSGILRPGDKGQIEARLTLPIFVVTNPTSATITLTGSHSYQVGDPPQGVMVIWIERKAEARPEFISTDAWDPIWANFVEVVGTTTTDFQTLLESDATYLGRIGVDAAEISDVNTLFGFELQQANATLPVPILATAVDASFPTAGLELGLGRAFLQPISGRYRLGALGRGWVHEWEVAAFTDTHGNVRIDTAGAHRFFSKLHDGSYLSFPGDTGVLTLVSGEYHLLEIDGTTTNFRTDGKLDSVEEPHGTSVTAGYNANGQLVSLTHSTGPALTIAYNAQGRIATVTDPAGRVDTYTYDASGEHLVSVTDQGGVTQYTYITGQGAAREHALASIQDVDGTHQFFTYDTRGRLSGQSRDDGEETTSYEYGSAGEVTVTDASGAKTLLLFDQNGRLRQVRDALDRRSSFEYDGAGDLVAYVSPTGLQWTYDRDARGNVVHTLDPLGHELRMTYDSAFNGLTSLTDAKGNTTDYGYDETGDLRSITYPNGTREQFDYDPLGNLTESINRREQAIDYQYDARGLLTKKTYADGAEIAFTYDARGNLKTAVDTNGTISLDYDAADRLTKITYPGGRFLSFTYDAGGRRTQSVDQDGFTVKYAFDATGRLSKLTDGAGSLIVEYAYDSVGRLSRKDLGNGTFTTFGYDAVGQLLSLVNQAPGGAVNSRFDYTYDAEGHRTSVTTADGTTAYRYDLIGQLTQVALPGGRTIDYVYDAAGNRVSVTDGGVTTVYLTNNMNQYIQAGTTNFTYDADGNLVAKTDGTSFTGYTFDDENRLIGSTGPDGVWSYQYDSLGNRSASTHDGVSTNYLVDPTGLGNVVAEYGAGGLIAHYTHGHGLLSRTAAAGSNAYYDFDATGNTVGLTSAGGTYANRYTYLPFGETTVLAAAIANPFTFVGEFGVMDAGGGLDFMRARFYDAATGQFNSDDPIGLLGLDTNARRFVFNDPTDLIDPSGYRTTSLSFSQTDSKYGTTIDGLTLDFGINYGQGIDFFTGGLVPTGHITGPLSNAAKTAAGGGLKGFAAGKGASTIAGKVLNPYAGQQVPGHRRSDELFGFGRHIPLPNVFIPNRRFIIQKIIDFLNSLDPNDITGPSGAGAQHFVTPLATLPYTIRFENAANLATAPAQEVIITHQLDTDLDWSSVELDDLGFGSFTLDVPDGLQSYQTRVTYKNQDGSDLFVDVDASFDLATGLLTWILRSVDPLTGGLPPGVFDGFLPVNDDTHRGEGFVRYFVRPKAALITGTTIDQQASIIFDVNPAIETNVFTNTIDSGTPTSSVNALPASVPTAVVSVTWSGSDGEGVLAGSGIASFDVLVSDNGSPYALWLDDTTLTSADYTGQLGHTYRFYVQATDHVGHVEPPPEVADTQTLTGAPHIALNSVPLVFRISDKAAAAIDASAAISNIVPPTASFDGAVLKVSGQLAKDKLSILKQNGISSKGKNLLFGSAAIGTLSIGKKGAPLTVTFNNAATQDAVQLLLRNIAFKAAGKATGNRTLEFQITKIGGPNTNKATRQIQVGT